MSFTLLISAVAPVIVILILGYIAGKRKKFTHQQARGFSGFALHYALPTALFLGMASFNRELLLQEGPALIVMLVCYTLFFLVAYSLLRKFGREKLSSVLIGYAVTSTAVPIYGLTVLVPVYGAQSGTGVVGLAALVTNVTQNAIAIYMLAKSSESESIPFRVIASRTATNPLVLGPLLGVLVAILGWQLPHTLVNVLHPLAISAAAVAIFACGLALSSYPVKFTSPIVMYGSLVCIIVQPILFLVVLKIIGLKGILAKTIFSASVMPTSTPSVLFAQQYEKHESELATIMLIATVAMIATLPITVVLGNRFF